ncbi:MAG TPA: CDP-glucose 4,6-dehydratase [Kiritimatiellia bacterium]|nr:CDP-glucose 4,6-dehydratase [Kiritimatiellia bacterium]HMO98676.1 CDP-glucose 4,6-dehydratase [Kiritimatiellia bacterium]HMP90830.1 CDP-glucose 4,6-dehydratase [Kiritimatiellia bacterium]
MPFNNIYRSKKVLVTGNTGFKGSWLITWLHHLGAEVYGLALPPENDQWLFEQAGLKDICHHTDGDIRDLALVRNVIAAVKPDIVLHLAAQAIVRASYKDPVGTAATNIMGTVNVLEAIRNVDVPCAAVMITSDKCYENREWPYAYRENDPMGGHDVYSMSKGAAELVVASYRRSFFPPEGSMAVASARAGNVIGPGDWAADRIVPDAMRTLLRGEPLLVRNPGATRPWQHVLEPLSGYLWLGAKLLETNSGMFQDGWNFGPGLDAARSVGELADAMVKTLGRGKWITDQVGKHPHEANFLRLSIEKASSLLGWSPVWNFEATVKRTVEGYEQLIAAGNDAGGQREFLVGEIQAYTEAAGKIGNAWATV